MRGTLAAPTSLFLAAVLTACTATREGPTCSTNEECRSAFGVGFVCQSDGFCELPRPEPNCRSTPPDLLLEPNRYRSYVVFGSLLRSLGKEGARQDAAELALLRANDWLELHEGDYPELAGLRFASVQCDHDGDIGEVTRLAHYLVDTVGVSAILGPATSSRTVAAFEAVNGSAESKETRNVLFISPSATSVRLTELESEKPGLLWRTAPMDDIQGRLMGLQALTTNMPVVAFYEDTPYGRGLFTEFADVLGDRCDDCGFPFEADTTDVAPLSRALSSDEARTALENAEQVVFVATQDNHLSKIIEQMDEPALADKTFFFSDAAASGDVVSRISPENASRVRGTQVSPPADTEERRFFESEYEARHDGESPLIHSFTAHAYDAAWLAVVSAFWAAINQQTVDPPGMAEGLRHLTKADFSKLDADECHVAIEAGEPCPVIQLDREQLGGVVHHFRAGRDIDVIGASGPVNYCPGDEELERAISAFELWHLEPTDPEDVDSGFKIVSDPPPDGTAGPPGPACPE